MKTSIANKIDYLANSRNLTETRVWALIDDLFDKPRDLIETVNYFIDNLKSNHNMIGKDWEKLVSITQWVDENNVTTPKQIRAVGIILALNWSDLKPNKNPALFV